MRKISFVASQENRTRIGGLDIGHIYFSGVRNVRTSQQVDEAIDLASGQAREKFQQAEISEDEVLAGIRRIFSNIGLDPTKERPSGEALLRRVLSGKGIYRINGVVDINNAISIATGYPCGVYDASRIDGNELEILVGKPGESYNGIGGHRENAENKIVTADAEGIFGGPTADSARTCVSLATQEVLMLIYHPRRVPNERLLDAIGRAADTMEKALGAKTEYYDIFSV